MAKENKRFVRIHTEGFGSSWEVYADRATRVQYLCRYSEAGGMCALLDKDGKPLLYEGDFENETKGWQEQN